MKRPGLPARRTPLVTKTPLRARKPLQRHETPASGRPCARTPIRQVSKRKAAQQRTRAALVRRLVAEGVECEVCPELARAGITIPGGCTGLSEIHERRKRSGAGTVEHAPNLIPLCRMANGWIEDSTGPDSARERFSPWLVLRPEHSEWADCGRRRDEPPVPVVVRWCKRCGAAHVTVPPSGVLPCGHRHAA